MSRYIDTDDLLNALKEERKNGNFVFTSKWIKEIIGKLPTADVVAVVRCKDCEYWDERCSDHIIATRLGNCEKPLGDYIYSDITTAENDYCSYGERREE